jgi:hypothetical protein
MRYELATLTIKIGTVPAVAAGIDAYTKDANAKGQLLGCWMSDIGALNKVFVLRAFEEMSALAHERARALNSANPFNCGDAITAMDLVSYAPFPWMPPVAPGSFGPFYEIRSYLFKTGGLPATMALWEKALPARVERSPLLIGMYALDGAPRFTHIWPYPSLDTRAAIRAKSVADGIWPPKGGPDWLTGDMTSTMTVPLANSPLK